MYVYSYIRYRLNIIIIIVKSWWISDFLNQCHTFVNCRMPVDEFTLESKTVTIPDSKFRSFKFGTNYKY